jgi:hypothetical protein
MPTVRPVEDHEVVSMTVTTIAPTPSASSNDGWGHVNDRASRRKRNPA